MPLRLDASARRMERSALCEAAARFLGDVRKSAASIKGRFDHDYFLWCTTFLLAGVQAIRLIVLRGESGLGRSWSLVTHRSTRGSASAREETLMISRLLRKPQCPMQLAMLLKRLRNTCVLRNHCSDDRRIRCRSGVEQRETEFYPIWSFCPVYSFA